MEKPKRNRRFNKILIIFLILVLFPTGSYSIQKNEKMPTKVIVGGQLLHMNIKTSSLMFYTKDDKGTILKNYDLVQKIEGSAVEKASNKIDIESIKRKDLMNITSFMKEDDKVKVTILRNGKNKEMYLDKTQIHHSYFTDSVPFSASLTYINPEDNSFGAVGHNIILENNKDALLKEGNIYLCDLIEIQKSNKNMIGSMQGNKIYGSQGNIKQINDFGAKGTINGKEILKNNDIYDVGKIEDVKLGSAQLLINDSTNDIKKAYEIKITKVNKQSKPEISGFEFKVTDKNLIKDYGGIVQGMSGCPIIQNGNIIGGLSHVVCADTSKGIGVYIEWMMED